MAVVGSRQLAWMVVVDGLFKSSVVSQKINRLAIGIGINLVLV